MNKSKMTSWGLLLVILAVSYLETLLETMVKGRGAISELGYRIAQTFQELEGGRLLENHEASSLITVYGYSLSYFFGLPLLGLGLLVAFSVRRQDWPLRVLTRALAVDYALSLPFFLFFPVPERWAYPHSGAMLLCDRWSPLLIEALRPISGLDNCFPSFHVSMSVVLVAMAYLVRVRLRTSIAAVAATIIAATFSLGIHWLPDIVAGVAVGIASVAIALRFEETEDWRHRAAVRTRPRGAGAG